MIVKRQLKPLQVIFYGLPGLPLAMLGLPLFIYLPTYYGQELGLSLSAVGLALLLARSLDVITDPLIGYINDRLPSLVLKGRQENKQNLQEWFRKSFILAGVPLLLVGINFLLKPADDVTALYLFIWSFVTYLGWTLINIPWLAWGAEISPDYHEKSALASSREIFAVIGTVAVISLPVLLSIQSDLKVTLTTLANLLTLLLPLTIVPLIFIKSKHTSQALTRKKKSYLETSSNKSFKQLFFELTSHIAIQKLLPAYFLNSFANALPATLFILFVTHVLGMPEKVGSLLISYFLSAIAGLPIWLYIARKTDKHRSWSIALIVSIAAFMWVPFLGQGDFNAFLIICLLSGFALGADVVLPASIQADISQHFTRSSKNVGGKINQGNQTSAGLLFGLWGLLTKLALALAVGLAFPLLEFTGLKEGEVSEISLMTLVILYALVPVILKVWVLYTMWNYPFGSHYFSEEVSEKNNQTHKNNNLIKGNRYEQFNETSISNSVAANTTIERV